MIEKGWVESYKLAECKTLGSRNGSNIKEGWFALWKSEI